MNKYIYLFCTDLFEGFKGNNAVFFAGYLAVSLFLNESHELLLLLVNTVLKVDIFFFCLFQFVFWASIVNEAGVFRIFRAPT